MQLLVNLKGLLKQTLFIIPVAAGWYALDRLVEHKPNGEHATQPWAEETISSFRLPQVQPDIAPEAALVKTLDDYAGRPLVVNFWASWCNVCLGEKPYLDSLWKNREKLRLQMVGIATSDEWDKVVRTGRADAGHFPLLLDADGELARAWNVTSLPQTLVVDPRGKVLYRIRGAVKATQVQELERMLTTDVMAMHGLAY